MPANVSLQKVTALPCCLCKLHNYCMNERESEHYEQTKIDAFCSAVSGSIPTANENEGNFLPKEMLGGRECADNYNRRKVPTSNISRDRFLKIIIDKDSCRPSRK